MEATTLLACLPASACVSWSIIHLMQFQDPKKKELGSSLKLLLVAEGKAHVCE